MGVVFTNGGKKEALMHAIENGEVEGDLCLYDTSAMYIMMMSGNESVDLAFNGRKMADEASNACLICMIARVIGYEKGSGKLWVGSHRMGLHGWMDGGV